jgi:flagellar export protein FliJ
VKRFEFPLERVLKMKRQRERLAELEQQRARVAVDAAQEKVQQLRNQLTRVAESLSPLVGRPVAMHLWASQYEHTERLGRSIQASEQEVTVAKEKLRQAAAARAQVATEVEALATLRQKQWDEWQQAFQKADQERLDEVGLRRWLDNKSGPPGGGSP